MRRSRPHRRRKPRPQDIGECQNQQTSLITTRHFGLSRAGLRRQAVRPAANRGWTDHPVTLSFAARVENPAPRPPEPESLVPGRGLSLSAGEDTNEATIQRLGRLDAAAMSAESAFSTHRS